MQTAVMPPIILNTGIYRKPLGARGQREHRGPTLTMFRQAPALAARISGIDLGLRQPEDVLNLKLSPENVEFIRSFPLNTAHFPYEYKIVDDQMTKRIFSALQAICQSLKIKHVTVHPQCITDVDFFWKKWQPFEQIGVLIENWMRADQVPRQHFESLFIDERVGLVLDSSHAHISTFARSGYPFHYFLPRFEDRLRFIHLAGNTLVKSFSDPAEPAIRRFCTAHHFMHQLNHRDLAFFEPVWTALKRNPRIGVIIEAVADTLEQFPQDIENEIDLIAKQVGDVWP